MVGLVISSQLDSASANQLDFQALTSLFLNNEHAFFGFTSLLKYSKNTLPVLSTKERTVGLFGEDGRMVTARNLMGVLLHLKCMEKISLFNTSIKLNNRGRSIRIQLKTHSSRYRLGPP